MNRLLLPLVIGLSLACGGLDSGFDAVSERASDELTEKLLEKAMEQANPGAEIDLEGDSLTIKSADGVLALRTNEDGKVPAGFPLSAPGVKISAVSEVDSNGQKLVSLVGECSNPDTLISTSKEELIAKGFKVTAEQSSNMSGMVMRSLIMNKGDEMVAVTVQVDKKANVVSLSWMQPKPGGK